MTSKIILWLSHQQSSDCGHAGEYLALGRSPKLAAFAAQISPLG